MQSKTVIKVDLARSSYVPLVEAIQGDGATRCVSVQLLDNGVPWLPPEKTDIAVVYTQPGGKKGLYNKLPDGSSAISISGSTVTAILAPNMLSVAGEVHAALVFSNNQLDQLSTFPFSIMVVKNQFAGAQQSEDYIRLQWLEDKLEERIAQLISTEECARAGVAAQEATIAAAAAQEQAAAAGNAAASANAAKENADTAASAASTAAAAAQAVVDGIVPEVEQLRSDITDITPDDAAVDGKPWTSRKIVDSLCQPFAETGNPVQCYPVEGYPLGVNIRIAPIQEGSGDPSPENVRPITGTVAVQIVHSNDSGAENTYDIALPETVYGGTLDLQTGLLTVDKECKILNGTEQVTKTGDGGTKYFTINGIISIGQKTLAQAKGKCSHFPVKNFTGSDEIQGIGGWDKAIFFRWGSPFETIEDVKTYIAEQYAADTPVQIYYNLNEPYTIQLTPQQITALSGVNTIYTDADGVIVTGAEDPKHTITELKNAILSLGGNI